MVAEPTGRAILSAQCAVHASRHGRADGNADAGPPTCDGASPATSLAASGVPRVKSNGVRDRTNFESVIRGIIGMKAGRVVVAYCMSVAFLVVDPHVARAQQGQLEEIIVTAEKREQSLQDVAASVTAFTDTYIAEAGIENAKDIAAHIPGMHLAVFSRMQALPTLRGAQSGEDSPGLDQPVAMFVDGVYKGRVTDWDLALFDVERIEVLRGPQGTLFGRNVVGGLINVVTKKPTDQTRVVVEAGGGNFNLVDLKGVVSAPVSAEAGLYGSITFSTQTRDGYTFNPVSGNDLDSIDKQAAKGQLRFAPSDSYEIL